MRYINVRYLLTYLPMYKAVHTSSAQEHVCLDAFLYATDDVYEWQRL